MITPDTIGVWATAIAAALLTLGGACIKLYGMVKDVNAIAAANKATADSHSQQIATLTTNQTAILTALPSNVTPPPVAPTAPVVGP